MHFREKRMLCAVVVMAITIASLRAAADGPNSVPNSFGVVENWAKLPDGRSWGQVIGVEIDPDGESVWVLDRCGSNGCMGPLGSNIDPIQKFDRFGNFVKSFGAGLFNWPHGFFVDRRRKRLGD